MSPLATLTAAWAAVYGYVGVYFGLLHAHRPADREYLSFGLLSVGLSIYSVGNMIVIDAVTLTDSAFGMRITEVGAAMAMACFVDFCHDLVGARHSRLPAVAYGWAGVGMVLFAAGLCVEPTVAAPSPSWGFSGAPDFTEAGLEPLGGVYFGFGVLLGILALLRLLPRARADRDVRVLLLGTVLPVLAGGHDLCIRTAGLRSVYLLEHVALLAVLAMGYVLLDRFVRTSDELRRRTGELKRSYEELRKTQRELVRKEQLAAVGELSAIIAHEVRNPLAIIKNAVSGLRRASVRPQDRKTLVGILDEETDRLSRLVRDLLAYAQPMSPQERPVELARLVGDAIERVRSSVPGEDSITLELDLDDGPALVEGDPDLIRQAVLNVVDNAMQAMPSGGKLTVRARPAVLQGRDAVELSFRDSGEGMDARVRDKARDPFYTTRPAGTGLGLAIVERVVRNHGGVMDIESQHGAGTTVRLLLPVRPGGRLAPPDADAALEAGPAGGHR